jgi:hypothetical protein
MKIDYYNTFQKISILIELTLIIKLKMFESGNHDKGPSLKGSKSSV